MLAPYINQRISIRILWIPQTTGRTTNTTWTRLDNAESAQLDPDAFAALFEEVRGTLRLVAASECGFDHADDIVQHSAIIALSKLDSFTPGTNFSAWTATIVRGVARNHRRSEQRRQTRTRKLFFRTPKQTSNQSTAIPNTDGRSDAHPGASPIGPDFNAPFPLDQSLREALAVLNPNQRACLLLRSVLEHSYSEIGAILGIPEATARSHVYRSRSILLDILKENPSTNTERSTP